MTPYMSFWRRIFAWVLWHYEKIENLDDAYFNLIEHPELSRTVGLLRDYYYIKRSK